MNPNIIYNDYWERCMKLQKENDELTQYACDLEDKICYLNGDIKKLQQLEQEHQRINGELREENEYLNNELNNMTDYAKGLQEENESLKEIWKDTIVFSKDYETIVMNTNGYKFYNDYKSRCEKASDKLGNYKHYSTPTEEQNSENEDIVDSALNILQNGSEKR